MKTSDRGTRPQRGFTLVDVLTTCALAGVLAGVAIPSYQSQLVKSRRGDAAAALTRLQAAQERYRSANGFYSATLQPLGLAARSSAGLYELAIETHAPERYRATASAVAGGPQAADGECMQLVLDVTSGFVQSGPSARCWNR
jgi:type IV pilus assembly protein PilE